MLRLHGTLRDIIADDRCSVATVSAFLKSAGIPKFIYPTDTFCHYMTSVYGLSCIASILAPQCILGIFVTFNVRLWIFCI
jgi:hypothetical protein